jgi:pimeloyl-ACP methyl ester carboxylesterase
MLRKSFKILGLFILYLLTLGLSIAAFFLLAFLTDKTVLLALASLFIVSAGSFFISLLTFRKKQKQTSIKIGLPLFLIALPVIVVAFVILPPFPPIQKPPLDAEIKYWDLPTGSRLAYKVFQPKVQTESTPIVFLHGGPGAVLTSETYEFYSQLTENGFTVYLYEQIGSGYSAHLSDMKQYTVERFVEDLEAVRKEIKTDKMILIGQSWGAILGTQYIAKYPEHVAKAIFTSPGELWDLKRFTINYDHTASAKINETVLPPPRATVAIILLKINPNAAQNFVSQEELANYFDSIPAPYLSAQNYCFDDDKKVPQVNSPGSNPYINQLIHTDKAKLPDPRPVLKKINIPVLIFRGECDFLPREATYEYKETFPNATLIEVPDAGHNIIGVQPDLVLPKIRTFLTNNQ